MIEWLKKWWWAPLIPVMLLSLAGLAVWTWKVKQKAAAAVALVALDAEREVAAEEALHHHNEAERLKREANTAVATMQGISRQLRETDHEKLAALIDTWY